MTLYFAQDYSGNLYITDERDCLPSDVTDFHEVFLPRKKNYLGNISENPTLTIQVQDFEETVSLERNLT